MSLPAPPYQVWLRPARGDDPWQKLGAPHADLTSAITATGQHQLHTACADDEFRYQILPLDQNPNLPMRDLPARRHGH